MKHLYISVLMLLQATLLLGHGFNTDTLVLLAEGDWQQISTICYRTQKKKVTVASYDTTSLYQTTSKTTRGGRSKSNCFIRFGFDERLKESKRHEVVCTPTQEFYNAKTHQWVPAYKLKVGDELLCANNATKRVVYIALIKESLDICTIEVKHMHTFFVTQHSLLTHNMVIPVAFSLGMSIPFGASAGGATGGFFGPITFVVGAAIGCAVGALVKFVCNSKIPTYSVEAYNVNDFEQHVRQQPQVATFSESRIVLSPDYVATNDSMQPEPLSVSDEHTHYDDNNGLLFSTTVVNLPKEKPGCGDTTPQKPLILITPAEPMPVFQNPGYSPPREEDKTMPPNGGCGSIPDHLKDLFNKTLILTEDNNAGDTVNKILEGASYIGKSNEGTKMYTKPNEYGDAMKDFESLNPDNVKIAKNGEIILGTLPDGRRVNVRKISKGNYDGTDKWPTLEIQTADGERSKIKIRYTKG